MAIMHPSSLENYKTTKSEVAMFEALRDQLPPNDHVFYSVRWFDVDEDDKRVNSESDFLVFDPNFGFLCIEVKGGYRITYDGVTWILYYFDEDGHPQMRKLDCSPYYQAEKSMYHFKNYFEAAFDQDYKGTYGLAVAFPFFNLTQPISQDGPLNLTLCKNDMTNLAARINEIFHYWRNAEQIKIPFSAEQRTRFLDTINKQVSLSAAAGALIPLKEKEFSRIDFVQDSILDLLANHPQVRIVGGAGTGKTFIAMKKVKRDFLQGKRILFLCSRPELAEYIALLLGSAITDSDRFVCTTYEELMSEYLGDAYDDCPVNANGNMICGDLVEKLDKNLKFDTIVVDEAQDFDEDMGYSVNELLRNGVNSNLYVFSDEAQNIFDVPGGNPFGIKDKPYILRYNIRNTGSIYQYATDKTGLGKMTVPSNIEGVAPETVTVKGKKQAVKELNNIVHRLVNKECVPTSSIAVVMDVPFESSALEGETMIGPYEITNKNPLLVGENEICVQTVDEFKGLEANVIIYLSHEFKDIGPANDQRREYVALTRARYYLYELHAKL